MPESPCPGPLKRSSPEPPEDGRYRVLKVMGSLLAPVLAILWLGLTLTGDGASIAFALVKIIFTIAVVLTGLLGLRWATASGSGLLVEAIAVALWMVLKVEDYAPYGALRTSLMLATPLAASGVILILADGLKAGTWPPARFRQKARR
ncbi:MAG: hypothetical protein GF400_01295 [Candidatus Eisenbacteria bacterium]|nr:hypothetical protein [Candidatus Eisenbacteria bacterium]